MISSSPEYDLEHNLGFDLGYYISSLFTSQRKSEKTIKNSELDTNYGTELVSANSSELVTANSSELVTNSRTGVIVKDKEIKKIMINKINTFQSCVDMMYEMVGGKDIDIIKKYGDNMKRYALINTSNIMQAINDDDKDYLLKINDRMDNYSKLYELSGNIEHLLEDNKETDIMLLKEGSKNIINNLEKLSTVFRSSETLINFFNKGTNKYSYMDLVEILYKYSTLMQEYINEASDYIDMKVASKPSKYMKTYNLINSYKQKLLYTTSKLKSYSNNLDTFNKMYNRNIKQLIVDYLETDCLKTEEKKNDMINYISNITNDVYTDISTKFILTNE